MFETNQNNSERILRLIVAAVCLPAPFVMEATIYAWAVAGLGAIMLFNAVSGTCYTYKMFGVSTCELPHGDAS